MALSSEDKRQIEHLLPVGFAFVLPYINWPTILALALLAVVHALYVSPRILRTVRRDELRRGFSPGKLFYAVGVLALLLAFHDRIYAAAAVWGILAAGDSLSNIVGRRFGRHKLPFNADKSLEGFLTFWLVGGLAAWILLWWNLTGEDPDLLVSLPLLAFSCALCCAIVEALPTPFDDNLLICWVGGSVMALLLDVDRLLPAAQGSIPEALVVNGLTVAVARLAGWLSVPATCLAALLGTVIYIAFNWYGFSVLLLFLILGSVATRAGMRSKLNRNIAEAHRGTRSVVSVFANGTVPFLLAVTAFWVTDSFVAVGYVAAVATATFDTTSTEIGQWLGKNPINPLTLSRVPPGAPGGISIQGTAAGLAAATLIAMLAWTSGWLPAASMSFVVAGAVTGGLSESILHSLQISADSNDQILNFFNTFLGAFTAAFLWSWL